MALPGYARGITEKVGRISDVLIDIARDPLLTSTLSLYGGTPLNLVHIKPIARLSEDLDFNYRHIDERDWGDVRDDVDATIKEILDGLGYGRDNIRIQPRYNIGRFLVHYESSEGLKDSFKIEIGYTRRIPDTRADARMTFDNPLTGKSARVLTPRSEELFANKWCTMVARTGKFGYPRDMFDVSNFPKVEYDRSLFIDLVMLESLLSELELDDVSIVELDSLMVTRLNTMLDTALHDIDRMAQGVRTFSKGVVAEVMERGWSDFKGDFDAYGMVRMDLLSNQEQIHPDFQEHPLLRWIIEKRKRRKL